MLGISNYTKRYTTNMLKLIELLINILVTTSCQRYALSRKSRPDGAVIIMDMFLFCTHGHTSTSLLVFSEDSSLSFSTLLSARPKDKLDGREMWGNFSLNDCKVTFRSTSAVI